jgi:signal transduction histidine kinase
LTSRREALFDVALVGALAVSLVALIWPLILLHGPGGFFLQLGFIVSLLFRRRAPLTVLLVAMGGDLGLVALARYAPGLLASAMQIDTIWVLLATPFAVYSAMVYGGDRRRVWIMVGLLTLLVARPWESAVTIAIGSLMLIALPALLGTYVAELNERVERAQREQHRLARQARVEERVRLAAEMHDVVTHRISLMVLQAGALGVTAADAATRSAAEDLRLAGCQALEELRDLVGVLRSAPGEADEEVAVPRAGGQAPGPDFSELLAESESVGVGVQLEQQGDPMLASPVVGRTVYRIVQESLTNVRKHAPGATVAVRVSYGSDRVRLTIRNSAPGRRADASLTASGSGTGLLGLRQRVELVSGTLHAGPTEDGGFEVGATLPAYVPTPDRGSGPSGGHTRGGPSGNGTGRPARPPERRRLAASASSRIHRARGGE